MAAESSPCLALPYNMKDSFTRPACLRLYCILMAGVGIVLSATWVATSAHVLVQQEIQDQRYVDIAMGLCLLMSLVSLEYGSMTGKTRPLAFFLILSLATMATYWLWSLFGDSHRENICWFLVVPLVYLLGVLPVILLFSNPGTPTQGKAVKEQVQGGKSQPCQMIRRRDKSQGARDYSANLAVVSTGKPIKTSSRVSTQITAVSDKVSSKLSWLSSKSLEDSETIIPAVSETNRISVATQGLTDVVSALIYGNTQSDSPVDVPEERTISKSNKISVFVKEISSNVAGKLGTIPKKLCVLKKPAKLSWTSANTKQTTAESEGKIKGSKPVWAKLKFPKMLRKLTKSLKKSSL